MVRATRTLPSNRAQTDAVPAGATLETPSRASYAQYSSSSGHYQDTYIQADAELQDKYIFTTAENFVTAYFPTDPATGPPPQVDYDALSEISKYKNEVKMYDPLIVTLQPAVAKNWKLVITSAHLDPDSNFMSDSAANPDLCLYGPDSASNNNISRSWDSELPFDLKTELADDPFKDTDQGVIPNPSAKGRNSRGQVITHLNAIMVSQFRTHSFVVFIVTNYCRLFRLTRSAMEVTNLFDYTASPLLVQFLWRFSHAPPDRRGLDTSFHKIITGDPHDSLSARTLLNAVGKPFWLVNVDKLSFYVTHPFTHSHYLPVGRGTRCFIAVETKSEKICLLKDTWRLTNYHPEAEVYSKLHQFGVRNITKVIVAAAVDGHYHRCGVDDAPILSNTYNKEALRDHEHYRLVLDVVGHPVVEFRSTHQLVQSVQDALQAHCDAWTKARVQHRDISIGNIITVVENGHIKGLLIDWELARYESDGGPRAYERIGTRPFMSAKLCLAKASDLQKRELADDLESFLLVLLWLAIAYAPGSMDAKTRASKLQYFDDPNPSLKETLILGGSAIVPCFQLESADFEALLGDLLDGFKVRYDRPLRLRPIPPASMVKLESHLWMMELLQNALQSDGWGALKDAGMAQPVHRPEPRRLKRKSEVSGYEGVMKERHDQASFHRSQDADLNVFG
ncbi:hypothetical protein C8R45DRAFT_895422 [Mycena sanguinolenta]|nr:hypothetical protein C8R45DRAFT_895422 [Mycena sanguinolenta]